MRRASSGEFVQAAQPFESWALLIVFLFEICDCDAFWRILGEIIRLNDTILSLSSRRSSSGAVRLAVGPADGVFDGRAQRRARTKSVHTSLERELGSLWGLKNAGYSL